MKTPPVPRKRKKAVEMATLKMECGESHVSIHLPEVPELFLVGIEIQVPSRKPVSAAEMEEARATFEELLRKRLPLKDGHCQIPIGENIAEVTIARQRPVTDRQLGEVLRYINNLLTHFPEKITKAGIAEDYVE